MVVLGDCIEANIRAEEEKIDIEMQMMAWQTALLMNSTGNYKKRIKPSDLYTPMAEARDEVKVNVNKPENKKQLQEDLLSAFAGSNIVIQ